MRLFCGDRMKLLIGKIVKIANGRNKNNVFMIFDCSQNEQDDFLFIHYLFPPIDINDDEYAWYHEPRCSRSFEKNQLCDCFVEIPT